ncbi:MAG: hypothetical protein L0H64_00935 [Pseudonocardia sp.]|nr:hypothetical protein [Pseudonocardia sp.]
MTAATLASYAITGRREIWPLFVVLGLLLVVVTGLLIAQFTDPDRRGRAEDRRALIAGLASDAVPAPSEKVDVEPASTAESLERGSVQPPDVEVPQQDRRAD